MDAMINQTSRRSGRQRKQVKYADSDEDQPPADKEIIGEIDSEDDFATSPPERRVIQAKKPKTKPANTHSTPGKTRLKSRPPPASDRQFEKDLAKAMQLSKQAEGKPITSTTDSHDVHPLAKVHSPKECLLASPVMEGIDSPIREPISITAMDPPDCLQVIKQRESSSQDSADLDHTEPLSDVTILSASPVEEGTGGKHGNHGNHDRKHDQDCDDKPIDVKDLKNTVPAGEKAIKGNKRSVSRTGPTAPSSVVAKDTPSHVMTDKQPIVSQMPSSPPVATNPSSNYMTGVAAKPGLFKVGGVRRVGLSRRPGRSLHPYLKPEP